MLLLPSTTINPSTKQPSSLIFCEINWAPFPPCFSISIAPNSLISASLVTILEIGSFFIAEIILFNLLLLLPVFEGANNELCFLLDLLFAIVLVSFCRCCFNWCFHRSHLFIKPRQNAQERKSWTLQDSSSPGHRTTIKTPSPVSILSFEIFKNLRLQIL